MLNEKYIAIRIKELCDKKHMTFYALSKRTGISESTFSSIMNRGSIPNFITLDRICDGLEITLAQFFTKGEERPDLTDEQKRVLKVWDGLADREKEAVEIYVRGIKLK